MAKYIPIELIRAYSGKVCMHSDTYFQRRGKDKSILCTGKICNPRDLTRDPYSANEIAAHNKFAQAAAAVKALTTEQRNAYKEAWKAQDEVKFLSAYIFKQEYAKLT